jgi:hypothetical protein
MPVAAVVRACALSFLEFDRADRDCDAYNHLFYIN